MADKNRVADKSTMHRYRIELPILIDDLDLSVYEFRLYVRFKRRSGDGGSCWEGARALAKACGMSAGQVAKAKKGLEEKGLIHVGTRQTRGGQTDDITLTDIWPQNFKTYASEESDRVVITLPESDHHTITLPESDHQVIASPESDQDTITLTSKRSPGDRKNHDQYHIGVITTPSPPTAPPSLLGDGDGDVFYRELRRRKVGQAKARQIASMSCDPARILALIDNRPNASDPNSLGRIILDILDGVIDAPPRAISKGAPPPPPAPQAGLTAEQLRELKRKHDYTRQT